MPKSRRPWSEDDVAKLKNLAGRRSNEGNRCRARPNCRCYRGGSFEAQDLSRYPSSFGTTREPTGRTVGRCSGLSHCPGRRGTKATARKVLRSSMGSLLPSGKGDLTTGGGWSGVS